MKIFKLLNIFLILAFYLVPHQLEAKEINMIFFYPGGEGSKAQAQPVLEEFAASLKEASNYKIEAKVNYFSNLNEGSAFIQNQKPAAGILAYDLFLSQGSQWQAKALLQTLQLPSGDGTNQYFLICNKERALPESGSLEVLSSRPLSQDFVKQKLFPASPFIWEVKPTKNILGKLRRLGMGADPSTNNSCALLNQFEWNNIKRLRAAWVAGLKVFFESQKIPSAPLVIFGNTLSEEEAQELSQALLKMSRQSKNKKLLEVLRLKGFAKKM